MKVDKGKIKKKRHLQIRKQICLALHGTHRPFSMNIKASGISTQDLKLQPFPLLFTDQGELNLSPWLRRPQIPKSVKPSNRKGTNTWKVQAMQSWALATVSELFETFMGKQAFLEIRS